MGLAVQPVRFAPGSAAGVSGFIAKAVGYDGLFWIAAVVSVLAAIITPLCLNVGDGDASEESSDSASLFSA